MTVTLHWWMAPLACLVIGIVGAFIDRETGRFADGLLGAAWVFLWSAFALGLFVGHFV